MTWPGAVAIMVSVAVLVVVVAGFAWWRRMRRDAPLAAPVGEAPAGAVELGRFTTLYVATTRRGEPLERLAIAGLGFRSRAEVTVTDAGVAIDLTGRPRLFIGADRIDDVAQATVAIDRVVERDGLVRLSWRLVDETPVDSYIRPQNVSARALADAIADALTPTQTGTDA